MPPRLAIAYLADGRDRPSVSCAVTWPLIALNTLGSSPSTAVGMQTGSQE